MYTSLLGYIVFVGHMAYCQMVSCGGSHQNRKVERTYNFLYLLFVPGLGALFFKYLFM